MYENALFKCQTLCLVLWLPVSRKLCKARKWIGKKLSLALENLSWHDDVIKCKSKQVNNCKRQLSMNQMNISVTDVKTASRQPFATQRLYKLHLARLAQSGGSILQTCVSFSVKFWQFNALFKNLCCNLQNLFITLLENYDKNAKIGDHRCKVMKKEVFTFGDELMRRKRVCWQTYGIYSPGDCLQSYQ